MYKIQTSPQTIIKEDDLLKGKLRVRGHIVDTQPKLVEEEGFFLRVE